MEPDAVISFALDVIGMRAGQCYTVYSRPDQSIRDRQDVDYLAHDEGDHVMAIEHTRIEPYEGYLRDVGVINERLGPIRDQLAGLLPTDSVFDITIATRAANKFRASHQEAIADWIQTAAPILGAPPTDFLERPAGKPFPRLVLVRLPLTEGHSPTPQIRYRIGIDLDEMKAMTGQRCTRALDQKLPKLDRARTAHGASATALVLETDDIQLTNPSALASTIRAHCEGRSKPVPDFLCLVITYDGVPSHLRLYRETGTWLTPPALVWRVADD